MRIIIFDIDCLRPDHLGCYGYNRPTSPNIDLVAGEGIKFTNYCCGSSPCQPSRTEWASGRFGIRNGVVSNLGAGAAFNVRRRNYGGPLPENEMLMRRLRSAGMDTISFSNFADRHCAWYFMSGWTEFHTPSLKCGAETAEEVNEPVIKWLRKNAGRDNYILHINYWDAHRTYKMAPTWAERFKDYPVTQPWPDEDAIRKQQSIKGPFTTHGQFKDDISPFPLMPGAINNRRDFEHMLTGYDTSIAYVDHHMGIIMNELASLGGLEDTAVIITSDHGDSFGEHGIYSDHVCADASIHQIPLIIKWPGVTTPGTTSDSMLYNVDLSPTLCELLNAEIPEDWDGTSFVPQIKGQPGLERDHLIWEHALYTVQRAVRTRDHLMIRTYDNFGYQFDEVELYNLTNDPYESTNIRDNEPEIVSHCEELLSSWVDEQLSKHDSISDPIKAVLDERGKHIL